MIGLPGHFFIQGVQTDFLHPQNSSDTFSFQKVKFPMI